MTEDLRRLTNAGLAENLRREAQQVLPGNPRRDWIIAPLLIEACARLVMAPPRDPLASARDERLTDSINAMYAVQVTSGAGLIAMERGRQVAEERFDADHDSMHTEGELAWAAACYAAPAAIYTVKVESEPGHMIEYSLSDPWPWDIADDKRSDRPFAAEARIHELAKAGALIAAEIDRIQRAIER